MLKLSVIIVDLPGASMADTVYQPPLADYAFLYREMFGRDVAASTGVVDADDALGVLAAAGEFAGSVLAPLADTGDRIGARLEDDRVLLPDGYADAYRQLIEGGWIAAEAPASAGGDGLPGVVRAGLSEIWHATNSAFALCWLLTGGQIHALDALASPELRETYLTKLVSGRWSGTMNLTEPDAGTDLGAIRTMATPHGDGTWSITGQKIFITWGDHELSENIVHLVLARTPDAPAGARGLSLFVAPRRLVNADGSLGARNGIHTIALEHKLGIHASPTCQLAYEDATGYLVGEVGGGLAGMFVMMNDARVNMGFQATGISEAALQHAQAYAAQRIQGAVLERPAGAPIAEHPDVRRLLRSIRARVFAMRALSVFTTDLFDRASTDGTRPLAEFFVPILKGWATEQAVGITSDALQVHGGMGYIEEAGAARFYRDVRILPIYEGTTAIQSNDLIGRKVLRDRGAVAEQLFALIDDTVAELRAAADAADASAEVAPGDGGAGGVDGAANAAGAASAVAGRVVAGLSRAADAARAATASLLGFAASPRDAHAVSVPYLHLLGTLAGGWMHALAVAAVLRHPTADAAERLSLADFYVAHQLPHVAALAETVAGGEIG